MIPSSRRRQLRQSPQFISWSILLLLSLVWGSSYILIKKSLLAFSPIQVACLRLSISAIAFFPFFIWYFRRIDWSKGFIFLIVGLTGSGIPAILFSTAQTEINSSVAGVLSSLTPLFTLIVGVLFFGATTSRAKIIGVLVGLAGAVILIAFGKEAGIDGNLWYGLFIVVGCLCYATSSNTVKAYLQEMSSIQISAATFAIIGIPTLLYLMTTDIFTVIQTAPDGWTSLGAVSVLALGGTVMTTVLFFKLVQMTNPVFASLVSYLIPIIAIFLGGWDGEPITILHLFGMLLILLGVYLSRN